MQLFKYFIYFIICIFWNLQTKISNIPSKKKLTLRQKGLIAQKHNQLKKQCNGDMYTIENEFGCFSVCVQNHFKYNEIGQSSYYTSGHLTATGEAFCTNNYTAAHPYLPLPCVAEVQSLDNPNKRILVKINDRGPFIQNHKVIIDLTRKGASELGFLHHGLHRVRVKVLKKETMMLSEYGGEVEWSGKVKFYEAVRISLVKKRMKKRVEKSKVEKKIKKIEVPKVVKKKVKMLKRRFITR